MLAGVISQIICMILPSQADSIGFICWHFEIAIWHLCCHPNKTQLHYLICVAQSIEKCYDNWKTPQQHCCPLCSRQFSVNSFDWGCLITKKWLQGEQFTKNSVSNIHTLQNIMEATIKYAQWLVLQALDKMTSSTVNKVNTILSISGSKILTNRISASREYIWIE